MGIRPVSISSSIVLEAAEVPGLYGSGDPGDCFLIATAHVENLSLVTRDAKIIEFAMDRSNCVTAIHC